MKIELKEISISELVSEYADNQENGVVVLKMVMFGLTLA